MKRVNSESNTKQGLSIAESCASSTTVKTSSNNNNIESKNRVYNAIVAAIKGDRMIGRHIAQTYGTNGPRPIYGIEVWESIVYVHTDTDRRIFDKAIDRLLKDHEDLFKWADFQKASEEGPHIVLALTDEIVKAKKEEEKAIREAEKAAKERETATLEPASEITIEGVKIGDKVRHNLTGDRVATVTGIRRVQGYKWEGEITVYRLDFGESVKGPCGMEMNGGEYQREAFTLQEASEIKPKATDSELESLTAKYAKQIEESALLGCGCMVGDGDETRKDSKCVKVRTAYKNDSHDAKDWTYCVSWYETTPIKGDADGQRQTLRECENGILLKQSARHMAYFELMARKGWTLDEILYGEAA